MNEVVSKNKGTMLMDKVQYFFNRFLVFEASFFFFNSFLSFFFFAKIFRTNLIR